MTRTLLAAAFCSMALMNVSPKLPMLAEQPPRAEYISIGISDRMISREDIERKIEAERAEAERQAAEQAKQERIEKMADGKIFTVLATGYCGCYQCCGKDDRITATGVRATEGRTIAADPRILPYGTHVRINGHEYVVEDCGGSIKGNRIDIYFESHEVANSFDPVYLEVEVIG